MVSFTNCAACNSQAGTFKFIGCLSCCGRGQRLVLHLQIENLLAKSRRRLRRVRRLPSNVYEHGAAFSCNILLVTFWQSLPFGVVAVLAAGAVVDAVTGWCTRKCQAMHLHFNFHYNIQFGAPAQR